MVYGGQLFVSEATKFNVVEEVFTVECNQMDVICNSFALNESMNIFSLNEGAFQTIINKIKELWKNFIAWLKKIWEKIKNFFAGKKKLTKEEITALGKEMTEKGILKKEAKVYLVDAKKISEVINDIKKVLGTTDKKTELLIKMMDSGVGSDSKYGESIDKITADYAAALKDVAAIREKLAKDAVIEVKTTNFEFAKQAIEASFTEFNTVYTLVSSETEKVSKKNKDIISTGEKKIKDLEKKIAEADKVNPGEGDKYDQNKASKAAEAKKNAQDEIKVINASIKAAKNENEIQLAMLAILNSIDADLKKSHASIKTAIHAAGTYKAEEKPNGVAKTNDQGSAPKNESVEAPKAAEVVEESTDLSFLDL